MYLHKTKNENYTPLCCYFSGELEVVEGIRNNGRFDIDTDIRRGFSVQYRRYLTTAAKRERGIAV